MLAIHCSSLPNGHWIAHRLGTISINEIRKSGQRIAGVTCKRRETAWSKERVLLCHKIVPVNEGNSVEAWKPVAAYQELSIQHISCTVFPSTPKLFQWALSYNGKWSHCSVFYDPGGCRHRNIKLHCWHFSLFGWHLLRDIVTVPN